MEVLIAVCILGAIGLFGGILLSVISALCDKGDQNKRLAEIREALPGANCGACGFAGCDSYAEAVDSGKADPNLCAPGGTDAAKKLAEVLGVEVDASEKIAVIACNGCTDNVQTKYNYTGLKSCAAAASLSGGPSACEFGCIGFGDCVNVCNFNAISVVNGVAVVNASLCTGCGICAKTCPKQVIKINVKKKAALVPCNNKEKGSIARKACKAACIGCSACVRVCEHGAVTVTDFLATIDADKCTGCGKCAEACPQKIIVI